MYTIRDVAKTAGVSISTVSHVVNKTRFVSPELVQRVESVINSLDTPPNFIVKKNLAERDMTSRQFVFLAKGDNSNPSLESALEKELQKIQLTLVSAACCSEAEIGLCQALLKLPSCAGLIVWVGNSGQSPAPELTQSSLPRVVIGQPAILDSEDYIAPDVASGAYQAILHLLRSGHEQIAFLGSMPSLNNSGLSAYRMAIESFSVAFCEDLVHLELAEEIRLFTALDALFDLPQPPTALYVASSDIVVPLLRYLEANNIRCPEDVSLICYGDFNWSSLYSPAIAVVHTGQKAVAKLAIERLIGQISCRETGEIWQKENITLPTKLALRASTSGVARGPFGEKAAELDSLHFTPSEADSISREKLTAAISFHYTGKAWMDLTVKGMTEVFSGLGINIIATTDAHFDPELQCRQLESLRLLKPDIVVGVPVDDSRTAEAFRAISQESRLVFIGNVPVGLSPRDYVSCITVNNRAYGRYAAQSLVEAMQRQGKKNVGLLKHSARFFETNQRDLSAEQLFSEQDGINICGQINFEWEAGAYAATLRLVRDNPQIEGLYVPWEGPGMEALRALRELGRTDIIISTGDLEYPSAKVMSGGGPIQCLIAQRPYDHGRAAGLAAAISMLGRKVPSFIAVEPVKVTMANLLKVWKDIYKEDAPAELREILRKTPGYIHQMNE